MLVEVDNASVVAAFAKCRFRNTVVTHALLLDLYNLQRKEGFRLRLQWVRSQINAEADAITRPVKVKIIQLRPAYLWRCKTFSGHLTQTSWLPTCLRSVFLAETSMREIYYLLFSRCACSGAAAIDVQTREVVRKSGSKYKDFNFRFPLVCMVSLLLQHGMSVRRGQQYLCQQ